MNKKRFWNIWNKRVDEKTVQPLRMLCELYLKVAIREQNASIPRSDKIAPFHAPHGLSGIFISKDAIIGEGCTILQQVTIGSNNLVGSAHQGAPVIGNNVYIGAGAKIIGGITVGENVRIGANCVVFKDIPPNCTVVMGGGMRIIEHS